MFVHHFPLINGDVNVSTGIYATFYWLKLLLREPEDDENLFLMIVFSAHVFLFNRPIWDGTNTVRHYNLRVWRGRECSLEENWENRKLTRRKIKMYRLTWEESLQLVQFRVVTGN